MDTEAVSTTDNESPIFTSRMITRDIGFVYMIANKATKSGLGTLGIKNKGSTPVIIRIAKSNIHLETYAEFPLFCSDEKYNFVTAMKYDENKKYFYVSFAKKENTIIHEDSAICAYSIKQVNTVFDNLLNDCRCSNRDFNEFENEETTNANGNANGKPYTTNTESWFSFKNYFANFGNYNPTVQKQSCGKDRTEGMQPINFLMNELDNPSCVLPGSCQDEDKKGIYTKCPKYDPGYYANMNTGSSQKKEFPIILNEHRLVDYSQDVIMDGINGVITAIDVDYVEGHDETSGETKNFTHFFVAFKSRVRATTQIRKLRPPYLKYNGEEVLKLTNGWSTLFILQKTK